MTSIVTAASGQSYTLVPVTSASTVAAASSAVGLSVSSDFPGLYEVLKKEDISEAKLVLLQKGDGSWIDGAQARAVLGLHGKASIAPAGVEAKAGSGARLFVQSTSSNRGLTAGSTLAVKGGAGMAASSAAPAAKVASKPDKPSAKSRARTASAAAFDDEDDDDEQKEEKKDVKGGARKKAKVAAAPAAVAFSSPVSAGSYTFIPVSAKATVDEVASGAGVSCLVGLYEVGGKTEQVSAGKELVLLRGDPTSASARIEDDAAAVRAALSLGAGKISVSARIVQAKAGADARLFVQSTSGNRGLLPGTMLCARVKERGASAGGASAAASAGPQPVSLASLFAAHYAAPAAPAAAAGVKSGTFKEKADNDGEDDENDMDVARKGDDGTDGPEFAQFVSLSAENSLPARKKFLACTHMVRWTSSDGRKFIIRAHDGEEDLEQLRPGWPEAWMGCEGQPIMAAVFEDASRKMVIAWGISYTADETSVAYLPGFSKIMCELAELMESGDSRLEGLEGCEDSFSATSGEDCVASFHCPSLEDGLTLADISQKGKGEGEGEGDGEDEDDEDDDAPKKKKKVGVRATSSASAAAGSSTTSAGQASIGAYVFIPVASKATIDEVASTAGVSCLAGLYEVGGKTEQVSAGKELVLLRGDPSSASARIEDDAATVRAALGLGAGKISVNARIVQAKAGADARLFVQSTSGNRGLLPGTMLCARVKERGAFGRGAAVGGLDAMSDVEDAEEDDGGGGRKKKAPTKKKAPVKKSAASSSKRGAQPANDDDDGEDDEGAGAEEVDEADESSAKFKAHMRTQNRVKDAARSAWVAGTRMVQWTSPTTGRKFTVRADYLGGVDEKENWPRVWFGDESQPVTAALFESGTGRMVVVWAQSMGGDGFYSAHLKGFAQEAEEISEIACEGTEELTEFLGISDECEFSFTAQGHTCVKQFFCPALDDASETSTTTTAAAAASSSASAASASAPAAARAPKSYRFFPAGDEAISIAALNAKNSTPGLDIKALYYSLEDSSGSEAVSADKELLLVMTNGPMMMSLVYSDDSAAVRERLGLPVGKAGKITALQVTLKMGEGFKLFIQSTSHNRKLPPGAWLCQRVEMMRGAGAAAAASSSSAQSGKKDKADAKGRKRGGRDMDDDEGEGEGDDGGDDGDASSGRGRGPPARGGGGGRGPSAGGRGPARGGAPGGPPDDPAPAPGGPAPGAGLALEGNVLASIDFSFFLTQDFEVPLLFAAGSCFPAHYASEVFVRSVVDEPIPAADQAPSLATMHTLRALDASGWQRDAPLEERIRTRLLSHQAAAEAGLAEALLVRAHVHRSAPRSAAVILLRLGEEAGDYLFSTLGPELVLVGCVGEHPVAIGSRCVYENSDGSGPALIVTQEAIDNGYVRRGGDEDGEEEEAGGEELRPTNVDDARELLAIVEKYFRAFCADQFH